ncbi:MAG TPA: winged helix-turn-helix domain-containing protein [Ideonella sp.]|uniref:ATP-binding protein n=1 Tax=Ideonella sp. TaxID=1929293 RepID=UPI002B51A15B|nr:winged helix-turn-helix domain-containing protein [Ideonella sp.]HSI49571.1 winged helix-turn-helix domain-containing protein [Ideonella sp.]
MSPTPPDSSPSGAPLRFASFEIRPAERQLLKAGQPAELGTRAFDLLLALAERRERVVSKHELLELVWPGLVVEENNIAVQVNALRKLLGGDVVTTIPGRGYRFTAPADAPAAAVAAPPSPEAVPAGVQPKALPTNLPRVLQTLRGRTEDLAALGAMLDQHELVSIVGAGGMGKTLLAQHLLARHSEAYAHGVCWVELATLDDAAALPGAIAQAAGLQPGPGEPLAALAAALAPLSLLIALDNAEHLLAAVAEVCQALVHAAPGLKLVVTSQAPLKLPLERVYRIGPLAVPQGPLPAAQALGFSAVALFAERAANADARFALTDANAADVIDICRALDGQALAIELAAARAPTLSVQRLASAMQDRLRLLTASRNRSAPPRQQTLRAALAWSHGLLAPREAVVFRRLAVFNGSFSLELAQAVVAETGPQAEAAGLDEWGVVDALSELVDRSLVALAEAQHDMSDLPRYRLLDSPRAYALEQLQVAGEAAALKQRHAEAVAAHFEAEWARSHSGELGLLAWERQLLQDAGNAHDALAWLDAAGDARRALQIASTWLLTMSVGVESERLAMAARCQGWLARLGSDEALALQARCLLMIGRRGYHDVAEAELALATARRAQAQQPDRWLLYAALSHCVLRRTLVLSAEAVPPEMLVELAALEDPAWPPHRRLWRSEPLGLMGLVQGGAAVAQGLRLLREHLALVQAAGGNATMVLFNLVDGELTTGDAEAAVRTAQGLLDSLQGLRDSHRFTMMVQMNLAAALLRLARCAEARALLESGWPVSLRFEWYPSYADHLSLLLAMEGRPELAARVLGYADAAVAREAQIRHASEIDSVRRTTALAGAALGEAVFQQLRQQGQALADEQVAALAFSEARA